jgi:hypothetical protein
MKSKNALLLHEMVKGKIKSGIPIQMKRVCRIMVLKE